LFLGEILWHLRYFGNPSAAYSRGSTLSEVVSKPATIDIELLIPVNMLLVIPIDLSLTHAIEVLPKNPS